MYYYPCGGGGLHEEGVHTMCEFVCGVQHGVHNGATVGLSVSVARRGCSGVVRAPEVGHTWACAAYCLLGEYRVVLALCFVTPCCCAPSHVCVTSSAGCCAMAAVV